VILLSKMSPVECEEYLSRFASEGS